MELKSIYLRNLDSDRVKSEYALVFKQFYDMVSENIKRSGAACLHWLQLSHYIEKYYLTDDVIWN